MNDSYKKAHALSLHLYSILSGKTSDGSNASEIVAVVKGFLKSSNLEGHLEVTLRDSPPDVGLVAKSEFGDVMLLAVYSRCESFPCPEGECKYASSNFCRSCGKLKR